MSCYLDKVFFQFGNVHIITGPNGKCKCGKGGKSCYEQLASIAQKFIELNATSTNTASRAIGACESCESFGDCVYSHKQAVVGGKSCWHQQQA